MAPWCIGMGLDIGFGGSAIVPHAITFDMPNSYTSVGSDKQILRGDCRSLSMFCDEALAWIFSAHILEDFYWGELPIIVNEWKRVLRPGGLLLTNCPDQQRFVDHCRVTGQGLNLAHKEPDFGLRTWNRNVVAKTGPWETVYEKDNHGPYSWLQTLKKL